MRLALPFACAVLAAGCGDNGNNPSAADMATSGFEFGGGSLTIAGCGYAVTTYDGAGVPVLGDATLGSDPTPWGIHLGLATDPATSMVVSWRTTDETTTATTVQFGAAGKTDQSATGITFRYSTAHDPVRVHETHLCGLLPDTEYTYRVGGKSGAGKEAWSDTATFRTAPARNRADALVTILQVGDSRKDPSDPTAWSRVMAKADALVKPDLIVYTGDAVDLGLIQSDWDNWLKDAGPILRRVPMLNVNGNHESNSINYYSQFAMPGNEEFYSLDYGPVHIVALNDTPSPRGSLAAQAQWLDTDLAAASAAPWKIVAHHKPPYSSDTNHATDGLAGLAAWGPTWDKYKVDLVLNGHAHDYERTLPMRAGKAGMTPADGTIFVVAGGSGAPLYDVVPQAQFSAVAVKSLNFGVVEARAGQLTFKAYKDDGTPLDTFMIKK